MDVIKSVKKIMKKDNKFNLLYVAWIPFLLGVLGYHTIEHIPFWEAVYASAALYFVNPVMDNNNMIIMAAKLTALLISATIIIQVAQNLSLLLKNKLKVLNPETSVIYTNIEQGFQLAKSINNGIVSQNGPEDSAENVNTHFIAFKDDMDNLRFYFRNEEKLKTCRVFIQLNQIEPSLLQPYLKTNVRVYSISDLIARDYWDKNGLFVNQLTDYQYKVAIVGFGSIGRAVFKKGFLNNLYSLDQHVEYHLWGISILDKEFLDTLNTGNDDVVISHTSTFHPIINDLRSMDRIILIDEDLELLQYIILELPKVDIHFYNNEVINIEKIICSERVKSFGDLGQVLHVNMIEDESYFRMGKLLNYDYYLRENDNKINEIEEDLVEREWNNLSGFHRESNLARADHFSVENDLRSTGIDDETIRELEHIRWCRFHYFNHWKYGEKKDSELKTHPLLVPYKEIDKSNHTKDDLYSEIVKSELMRLSKKPR